MTVAPSLRPLGNALGTEAVGVDLARDVDDATIAWIERAFAEHPVLVFRDQQLDAAALAAFGARFGRPQPHILEQYRHPDEPMVSYITNVAKDGGIDRFGVKRASSWHTDETYEEALPRLAILHAVEMPATKGGTIFADMRAAYDALPAATKQRLDGLIALHGHTNGPDAVKLYGAAYVRKSETARPVRRHPAVRRHPVTGRAVLFVNPTHTHGFAGMDEAAGLRLIEELRDHATQEQFTYYHSWRVGDVLMWDEVATMHRSAGDARADERRIMLRTIVHPN
ncbi:MAG: TauD/TfdA family dioxygenase [Proteobacteria bacterium]|nr:TauD/TfdA family dioxygenase [Pseudomonadota bacterium]